jgi:hypothetical protein
LRGWFCFGANLGGGVVATVYALVVYGELEQDVLDNVLDSPGHSSDLAYSVAQSQHHRRKKREDGGREKRKTHSQA